MAPLRADGSSGLGLLLPSVISGPLQGELKKLVFQESYLQTVVG